MPKVQASDLPEAVHEVIRKIVEGYDPEKIIVFGSYARGDWNDDSDLDVLVVKDTEERPFDRIGSVSVFCWPRELAMDILVKTPGEIEDELRKRELFTREVMREGIVVHERASA
ncbi:MAG: nucleotidyltransferase domain-containing protein [candidate division WS1 bacterium]|jgi:predicted nucleotidyltransferase|nr:nucleotidyltransferase domain-containing protein [candidate division WS1 bacterium]